ncbi:hypothetical protein LTR64_007718 [Lithohypha guttulata]|uniref:uncharacterized protein n=1 Tax=Lithohypha guttulata TaxID=1690604 RepID=UPI002DDEF19C|nr:hypothetical protein LTR51_007227 [Lithohypha guttulata]
MEKKGKKKGRTIIPSANADRHGLGLHGANAGSNITPQSGFAPSDATTNAIVQLAQSQTQHRSDRNTLERLADSADGSRQFPLAQPPLARSTTVTHQSNPATFEHRPEAALQGFNARDALADAAAAADRQPSLARARLSLQPHATTFSNRPVNPQALPSTISQGARSPVSKARHAIPVRHQPQINLGPTPTQPRPSSVTIPTNSIAQTEVIDAQIQRAHNSLSTATDSVCRDQSHQNSSGASHNGRSKLSEQSVRVPYAASKPDLGHSQKKNPARHFQISSTKPALLFRSGGQDDTTALLAWNTGKQWLSEPGTGRGSVFDFFGSNQPPVGLEQSSDPRRPSSKPEDTGLKFYTRLQKSRGIPFSQNALEIPPIELNIGVSGVAQSYHQDVTRRPSDDTPRLPKRVSAKRKASTAEPDRNVATKRHRHMSRGSPDPLPNGDPEPATSNPLDQRTFAVYPPAPPDHAASASMFPPITINQPKTQSQPSMLLMPSHHLPAPPAETNDHNPFFNAKVQRFQEENIHLRGQTANLQILLSQANQQVSDWSATSRELDRREHELNARCRILHVRVQELNSQREVLDNRERDLDGREKSIENVEREMAKTEERLRRRSHQLEHDFEQQEAFLVEAIERGIDINSARLEQQILIDHGVVCDRRRTRCRDAQEGQAEEAADGDEGHDGEDTTDASEDKDENDQDAKDSGTGE